MCIKEKKCWTCVHFIGIVGQRFTPICEAFPEVRHGDFDGWPEEGIPREIYSEKIDHIKPYPGDNGFQYEEIRLENDNLAFK